MQNSETAPPHGSPTATGRKAKRPQVQTDGFDQPYMMRVRRRDLRRLAAGPRMFDNAPPHAAKGDRRYPSGRRVRAALAFVLDLALHVVIGYGAWYALQRFPEVGGGYAVLGAFGVFVVASFVHRTIVQAAFHATLGKALCGLRVIRQDSGAAPGVGYLIAKWLLPPVAVALYVLGN